MTREEAALILDPETSRDALLPYESQEERIAVCEEACRLGAAALREQEKLDSPLSAFLAPMDSYKGLKRKFLVFRSDTGEMIENCFVLRPGKDPAAVAALRAYAEATDNDTLAADIISWVGTECNDPLALAEEV